MRRHKSLWIVALACIAASSIFWGLRPIAASADASTAPPASVLFDDVELPYHGLGVVWIRADGLIIVEIGDKLTVAFETNVAGLSLVEKDNKVGFYQAATNGEVLHQFPERPVAQAAMCSAAYHIVGYLELDYDATTGELETGVDGVKQVLKLKMSLSETVLEPTSNGAAAAALSQSAQQCSGATCYCTAGIGLCEACKVCPAGYECACRCEEFAQGGSRCNCSTCSRVRGTDIFIVPEDAVPVEP